MGVRVGSVANAVDLQALMDSVPSYVERVTGRQPVPEDAAAALGEMPPGFPAARKLDLGLWEGRELVAFVNLVVGFPDESCAFIGLLAVHGRRQRRGLGRTLHAEAVRRAGEDPAVKRLRLAVVATTAAGAELFWQALGYVPTGEVRPYQNGAFTSSVAFWERPVSNSVKGVS